MLLSDAQYEAYKHDGFIKVPAALDTQTVQALLAEWRALWRAIETARDHRFVHWRNRIDGERVADRLDPVSKLSETFSSVAHSAVLLGLAERLLGGDAFVMKDKLITKRPGTAGYDLHQDWPYWEGTGVHADDIVTVAVALDPANAGNGATAFYPALHSTILERAASGFDPAPDALTGLDHEIIELQAGDAVCFHSLTPHESRPNNSSNPRRAWFITYARQRADSDQVMERYWAALDDVHQVHRREPAG